MGDGAAAAGFGVVMGDGFHESPVGAEKFFALSHGPRMICFEGLSAYTDM